MIQSKTARKMMYSWHDAIEWVSCACNNDRVTVTDTAGHILAVRG